MICPLMTAGNLADPNVNQMEQAKVECLRKDCAWWCSAEMMCGLNAMVVQLMQSNEDRRG